MCADLAPLSAGGDRVWIHTVTPADLAPYRVAVEGSQARLAPWNPVNPHDLAYHLRIQSPTHRTFLVRAREGVPDAGHDIVGKINLTHIVRARAHAGVLGYDSYDPYAGQGLFAEGMRLLVGLAFTAEPHGLGLNRVEAAVQPGNTRSAGLLRSLGFRRRGASPAYLWLADVSGRETWRDHVLYGVTAGEWADGPYAPHASNPPVLLVGPVHGPVDGPGAALERGCAALAAELEASLVTAAQAAALSGVADAAGPARGARAAGLSEFLRDSRGPVVAVLPAGLSAPVVVREAGLDPARVLVLSAQQAAASVDPAVACEHALTARALAAGAADPAGRVGGGRSHLAQ